MSNKYYLKNIKVENKAITGDCPICGHKDIGFNYGGNASSHPIGCGWAGSFAMACPGCGSIFGHGGHEMPTNTKDCLYMLEDEDVLQKRIEEIKESKEYMNSFKKEKDLLAEYYAKKNEKEYVLKDEKYYYLTKQVGRYIIYYHPFVNTLKVVDTFVCETFNFSFLLSADYVYKDKYATGREGRKPTITKLKYIKLLEDVLLGTMAEFDSLRYGAVFGTEISVEILERNKNIADYHYYKSKMREIEKAYPELDLTHQPQYTHEALDKLSEKFQEIQNNL